MLPPTTINFKHLLQVESYKNTLREWRNQSFVRENMLNKEHITEEQHLAYVQSIYDKTRDAYIGFIDNEPFGVLQLTHFPQNKALEFGYYLVDKRYLNSGLGVIIEYKMLEYGFEFLGVERIFCRTLLTNEKVIRIHKKFGFQIEDNKSDRVNYCMQSITPVIWELHKSSIEKIINTIIPISQVRDIK